MYTIFHLREDFLALVLAWPDAINHISCLSNVGEILTLNVFFTDFSADMPLLSFFCIVVSRASYVL